MLWGFSQVALICIRCDENGSGGGCRHNQRRLSPPDLPGAIRKLSLAQLCGRHSLELPITRLSDRTPTQLTTRLNVTQWLLLRQLHETPPHHKIAAQPCQLSTRCLIWCECSLTMKQRWPHFCWFHTKCKFIFRPIKSHKSRLVHLNERDSKTDPTCDQMDTN